MLSLMERLLSKEATISAIKKIETGIPKLAPKALPRIPQQRIAPYMDAIMPKTFNEITNQYSLDNFMKKVTSTHLL